MKKLLSLIMTGALLLMGVVALTPSCQLNAATMYGSVKAGTHSLDVESEKIVIIDDGDLYAFYADTIYTSVYDATNTILEISHASSTNKKYWKSTSKTGDWAEQATGENRMLSSTMMTGVWTNVDSLIARGAQALDDCPYYVAPTFFKTDVNVDIIPVSVSITLPLNVNCVLTPDTNSFVATDLTIENATKAPVVVSVKAFKPTTSALTMFNGTTNPGGIDIYALNSVDSKKYMALGITAYDGDDNYSAGWDNTPATGVVWCNFTNNDVIGTIKGESSVNLYLDVKSGMAFKEAVNFDPFQLVLVAELE